MTDTNKYNSNKRFGSARPVRPPKFSWVVCDVCGDRVGKASGTIEALKVKIAHSRECVCIDS